MPGTKRGLANADEETKNMVSDLGNEAQGHDTGDDEEMESYEPGTFEQTNMDISGLGVEDEDGEPARGFEKMKEKGRDEEVSDIASEGGAASHGGGRPNSDEE